jgi:protein-tyrosine phosphatase
MEQIPPHPLWLGHAGDGRDLRSIFAAGILARVELAAEETPAPTPRDLIACRFPLVDGGGNDSVILRLALHTVAWLLEQKTPTLLCCGAGMSRSPAIAAGAMALLSGEHPEDCLRQVVLHRPADVVPALWNDVITAVQSLR